MSSRWATRTRRTYLSWLDTASHEFFHAWNVKRLRPIELGPFNYESENETRSLWIAEGITEYYGALNLHRAGISSREELLDSISSNIEELQTTPGRLVQSAEQASFDAWIKYYRPDENSVNTAISYYTKGAVLGFLLDAKIRKATDGAKSLDDVMRTAYQRFAGTRGYTPGRFPRRGRADRGDEPEGVLGSRDRGDRRNSTTPKRWKPSVSVFVRPRPHRARGSELRPGTTPAGCW